MSIPDEEKIINKLAFYVDQIDGIGKACGYAQNLDNIPSAVLPVQMFYPMQGDHEEAGHYNIWRNVIRIRGSLFVTPVASKAAKLKFIENDAIPFARRYREMFQTANVVRDFLGLGLQRFLLRSMKYGAGGQYLTHMGVEYVGYVIDWDCVWKAAGA